jgi:hypothetical protein
VILFCSDPLNPRRPDGHFAAEAEVAGAARALIDHDALLAGDAAAAVGRVPAGSGPYWYRGWMIPVQRYADLAAALAARGVGLHTSPERYRRAHELPGWIDVFRDVTPETVWAVDPADAIARAPFGGPGSIMRLVGRHAVECATNLMINGS